VLIVGRINTIKKTPPYFFELQLVLVV